MKLRILAVLAGTLALAGCSSTPGAGGSASPTATPRTAAQASKTRTSTAAMPTATKPSHVTVASGGPMSQGQSYMKQADYAAAQAAFTRATRKQPKSTVAYERLGIAALDNRDYKAAFAAFKKASALRPHDTTLMYYAAGSGLYAGQYATARNYIDKFIAAKPNFAAAYHLRLLVDGNLLDRKAQLRDAREVMRLQPNDPNASNDLGLALANNRKISQAYAAFSRAIALQPGNWQFYKNRALVDGMNKSISAEIRDLKHALRLAKDPGSRKAIQDLLNHAQRAGGSKH